MKLSKTLALIAAMTLAAVGAQASVTYAPWAYDIADASGNFLTSGSVILVLDLDGDGWDGVDYTAQAPDTMDNASSWQWDADDIVSEVAAIEYEGEGEPFLRLTSIPAGYDANADNYYVLWFDIADAIDGPGLGVAYGAALAGAVAPDGYTMTPDVEGGVANLVTVPEPTSALVLLAGLIPALRRRRA